MTATRVAARGVEGVLLASTYFALAKLGIVFGSALGNVSPIWPAAGAAIAWLTVRGVSFWPGVFLGTLAAVAQTRAPWSFTLWVSGANALEAAGVALAYRRLLSEHRLSRPNRPLLFAALSTAGTAVCAVLGASAAQFTGIAADHSLLASAGFWFMGDLFGALVVAAPVVGLFELLEEGTWTRSVERDRSWLVILALGSTLGVSWWSSHAPPALGLSLRFAPLILGALVVIAGGWFGRTLVVFAITTPPTYFLLRHEAAGELTQPVQISLLQIYNVFSALYCLAIGALFDQVRAAEQASARLAQSLKLSNERLEEFVYVAAHDLRSPLRSIINWTQVLGKRLPEPRDEKVDQALHFVQANANRSVELISAVMNLARVQTAPDSLTHIDLNEVVQKVLYQLDTRIRQLDARVEVGPLPSVQGHTTYFELLFTNLLDNALAHGHPERSLQLRIGGRDHPQLHEIFVQDNGVGVPPEDRDRIFQIFARGSNGGEVRTGAGVGLALCRRIVQSYGGSIWVDSTSDGSTFTLTHPKQGSSSSP